MQEKRACRVCWLERRSKEEGQREREVKDKERQSWKVVSASGKVMFVAHREFLVKRQMPYRTNNKRELQKKSRNQGIK